jgi:hypothetical protein
MDMGDDVMSFRCFPISFRDCCNDETTQLSFDHSDGPGSDLTSIGRRIAWGDGMWQWLSFDMD